MDPEQDVHHGGSPAEPLPQPGERHHQYRLRLARNLRGRGPTFVLALLLAAMTFGNGVVNLYSLMGNASHPPWWRQVFPIEFIRLSRSLTLVIGFALIISSLSVLRRKRRAWAITLSLAGASVVFHLAKGLDYEEALTSAVVFGALLLSRRIFTVRSGIPDFQGAATRLVLALVVALGYGMAGFWFLDERHFHVNFHYNDAIVSTLRLLAFVQDPRLVPHTGYARWFLMSVYLITTLAVAYSGLAFFHPVVYQFRTVPRERATAMAIASRHARTALDYFKLWQDKSFFFSVSRETFIAYRVARHVALVLGDPVGPREEVLPTIREFVEFCHENGWTVAFHQTTPEFLPEYRAAKLKRLKIGDDAVVDLTNYTLEGKDKKDFRYKIRQMEGMGISFVEHEPPVRSGVMQQLRQVSDEWLKIPGRRERKFTLGYFEEKYVAATPVFAAVDSGGAILAFVNLTALSNSSEASVDLMRRKTDSPNGVMEYLFVKTFLWAKEHGYTKFSLGMAPMAGFQEQEHARRQERAVHSFFQQLNFLFSFRGLRAYKSKFATGWEPRYLIFERTMDLPKIALALRKVSEMNGTHGEGEIDAHAPAA